MTEVACAGCGYLRRWPDGDHRVYDCPVCGGPSVVVRWA